MFENSLFVIDGGEDEDLGAYLKEKFLKCFIGSDLLKEKQIFLRGVN